jgi:uncharacterized membrane protein
MGVLFFHHSKGSKEKFFSVGMLCWLIFAFFFLLHEDEEEEDRPDM